MPRDDLPRGTIIAERYRVLDTAGSGGMGIVYVVEDLATRTHAALKIMRGHASPRTVERFRREARASGIIRSEHVVRVTDADIAPELDDAPFLVMELLRGEDLSQRLDRRERLDRQETVDILAQMARGLERAHAAGVVHRDLKPQNIFLHEGEDGAVIVKLVDFGISRIPAKADGRENTGLTRAEDIVGTPSWMAPEQAMAMHHAVGPATDIWAVGLLAFRMLHGDSYWGERDASQILSALMQPEREMPSEIDPTLSPAFDEWFAKSCAREPERRFQNALAQADALAAALRVDAPRLLVASAPIPSALGGRGDATPATDVNHPIAPRAAATPTERIEEITLEPVAPEPAPLPPFAIAPLDPLLAPAKPSWTETLKPHLLWILPTAIFASVFALGLVWILSPDPPLPEPAPAASTAVRSAPPPAAADSSAPAIVEVPAPPAPRPRPKRAPTRSSSP